MKSLYYILVFVLFVFKMNAQIHVKPNKKLDHLATQYHSLFLASKKIVERFDYSKFSDQNLMFDFLNQNNEYIDGNIQVIEPIQSNSISNFGLKWISDYTHNFGFGGSDDEDVYFRSKVSTGLDWVILGEGSFFKNKNDLKLNQIEIKKDSLEFIQLKNSNIAQQKIDFIKYIFEIQKIDLLKSYADFLKEKVNYTNNLFDAKLINYADKLKVENEYSKIKNQIALNENYLSIANNQHLINEFRDVVYADLNLPNLEEIQFSDFLNLDTQIGELEKELIRKDRKNSDKPTLRAKVRYNLFNSDLNTNRTYASVGASLSVPIKFGKDQALEYKIESIDNKLEFQKLKAKERLEKLHYDFYTNKNELKNLQNDLNYIKALLDNEMVVYTKYKQNFSPEKYIEFSMQFLRKQLEILNVNQKVCENFITYQILYNPQFNSNQANSKQQTISNSEIISNSAIVSNNIASYLWSKTFDSVPNSKLIEVINSNNIKLLFLSPGKNHHEKLVEFVQLAKANDVKIHRLIGENSYVNDEEGIQKFMNKLNGIDTTIYEGIHLDIEPHTFADYKENSEKYIDNLNKIFIHAKQWSNEKKLELSVSIPMNLPNKNAEVLSHEKIETFIMAYENNDQNKLLKRTENLRKILNENFVWVLKLSDFKTDESLQKALKELKNHKVTRIGYYDVSTLLNKN